jgi:hypothetical protein
MEIRSFSLLPSYFGDLAAPATKHDVNQMNAYMDNRVCPFDSAGQILIKFGLVFITLDAGLNFLFLNSYNQQYQHEGRTKL